MKKPIVLDARMWDHPGIGRYVRELSGALVRSNPGERLVFLARQELHPLMDKELALFGKYEFREAKSGIYSIGEQLEIGRLAQDAALLHVPHFNIPVRYSGKLVVT